jgi:Family of unknown function (DUF6308)
MVINIPLRLRDENFATCLVKRYLATDTAGRAYYSGAHFERIGGGGDRPEVADQFTAEDLLAVTMLSVRIEGYHPLEILRYRARELNDLLAQVPNGVARQDPVAGTHIAKSQPA